MRLAIVLLALGFIVAPAMAEDSASISADGPTNLPQDREAFYCQAPQAGWNATNASSGFVSELADDIPNDLVGNDITMVTFYVAQWAGNWQDPLAFTVNFYDGTCPPAMDPALSYTVDWANIQATFVYQGSWYVKECVVPLPEAVTITENMSIGGLSEIDWGQNPPYTGLCLTDEYTYYGCGSAYWAGDNWGYPRWTSLVNYFGYDIDMAYCLDGEAVAAQESSWGKVKSLFR
ncbi:MAG: hypothetical protein GF346_13720 [Candidatus Eisenbacteria bacterium]|nr:hypothetical protein [Candidatus Latescibacterota bacterium]MBD3303499.1 hypothetical protein [Candidatus Eisenbacteria bacterium]